MSEKHQLEAHEAGEEGHANKKLKSSEVQPDLEDSNALNIKEGLSEVSSTEKLESSLAPNLEEEKLDKKSEEAVVDPLSYTRTKEFTSEIFKIQIRNLPPKFGFSEFKNRLKSHLQLNPHKIKSDKRYVTYVCFKNTEDRDKALSKINGHVWKGRTLEAKIAAPVADPFLQKRQNLASDQVTNSMQNQQMTPEEAEERLRGNVSPLWNVDYSEQLKMKTDKIRAALRQMAQHSFVKHLFQQRTQKDGLPCELLPIVPSPVTSEYRNKNEFTVGYGLDAQTIVVGFRYGLYKDGTTAVGDCSNLGIAMPSAIPVVKSFTQFVTKSQWAPYRQEMSSGHWQTLAVRTYQTGDVMAMIDFVPRSLEKSEIEAAKASVKEFYTTGEGKDVNITSFYFRVLGGKGQNPRQGTQLLFGSPDVYETLLQLKFRISPEAFFQVNTAATERLYELISDWAQVSPSTVVLDICCGTGTIGLTMAKKVKEVIGIEMCQPAVDDAKVNASLNGISNATFHCAKVENIIGKLMLSLQSSAASSSNDIVAVVDPPRAGLHKDVIKTLRRCAEIQRLIFVSCNPNGAVDNFVDLIRSETSRLKGSPFTLVKAVPVDLFPGTNHCELVLLFTRENTSDKETEVSQPETEKSEEAVGDIKADGTGNNVQDITDSIETSATSNIDSKKDDKPDCGTEDSLPSA